MENFRNAFIFLSKVSSISFDMSLILLLIVFADNGTLLTSSTSFVPSINQTISRHAGFNKISPIVCVFFLTCNQFSDMITGF